MIDNDVLLYSQISTQSRSHQKCCLLQLKIQRSITNYQVDKESRLEVSIESPLKALRTLWKEELQEPEGSRTTGENRESTKQGSQGLTETETTVVEPAWVYARSSACMLWALDWCLGGSSYNGSVGIADSFVFFWDPFPGAGLPCPVLMWGGGCLVLLYLIVTFCVPLMSLESLFCYGQVQGQVHLGKRRFGGGEVEGGKPEVGMYCMREYIKVFF